MTTYDESTLHEALAARIAERNALDNLLSEVEEILGCEREDLAEAARLTVHANERLSIDLEAQELAAEMNTTLAGILGCEVADLVEAARIAADAKKEIDRSVAWIDHCLEMDRQREEAAAKENDFRAEVPGFDGTPDSPPIGPTVRPPGLAGASLAADFMAGKLGLVIRSGNTARFVELED